MKPNRGSRIAVVGGLFLMLSGVLGGDGMFINGRIRFFLGLAILLIGIVLSIREKQS